MIPHRAVREVGERWLTHHEEVKAELAARRAPRVA
jgi:hypothetical protein